MFKTINSFPKNILMKSFLKKRHIQITCLAVFALVMIALVFAFLPSPQKISSDQNNDIMQAKVYEEGFEKDTIVKNETFETGFDEQLQRIIEGDLSKELSSNGAEIARLNATTQYDEPQDDFLNTFDEKKMSMIPDQSAPMNKADSYPSFSARINERFSDIQDGAEAKEEQKIVFKLSPTKQKGVSEPKPKAELHYPEKISPKDGAVKIAIVIDDMGMNFSRLKQLSELARPINFAFLPYAENLHQQTQYALSNKHHLIVHMPMKPKSDTVDAGPVVLKPGMTKKQVYKALEWGLSRFEGYRGINNHMGSAFTEDVDGMGYVMSYLKEHGFYFLDSKTTAESKGRVAAAEHQLPMIVRDVFLDHENDLDYILGQLEKTEQVARQNGYAIAIGHPYINTIEALTKWFPTLKEKGIELVTVEELIYSNYDFPKMSQQIVPQTSLTLNDFKSKTARPLEPKNDIKKASLSKMEKVDAKQQKTAHKESETYISHFSKPELKPSSLPVPQTAIQTIKLPQSAY